jgi:3-deoxy-D-manno-octulosonic-acid transferase
VKFLYNLIAVLLVLFALPVFCWRLIREPGFGERLRQNFGFLPATALQAVAHKQCLWLHAASIGEVVAASPIIKELRAAFPERPLLVSTVTVTGHEMAKKILPDADCIIFAPLDLPFLSAAVVRRIQPGLFMLVETELWPNFLQAMENLQVPVVMVNGRISDKSAQRYGYLLSVLKQMLQCVSLFCMQSELDAAHIIALGAPRNSVVVTGNTKFDQTYTMVTPEAKRLLLASFGFSATACPIFIAGSTHEGEEEAIFEAYLQAKQAIPNLKLILAPRNIRRADEVEKIAASYSVSLQRRTKLSAQSPVAPYEVILLDTIGELGQLYSLGDIIFVGGSLIPQGGHNILEPAAHGKPILVGPHMFNFKESYALLSGRGACLTVHDSQELAAEIVVLLQDPRAAAAMGQSAAAIMLENSGAAKKSVDYLRCYVQ